MGNRDIEEQRYRKSMSKGKNAPYGLGSDGKYYPFSFDRKSLEGGKGVHLADKKVGQKKTPKKASKKAAAKKKD